MCKFALFCFLLAGLQCLSRLPTISSFSYFFLLKILIIKNVYTNNYKNIWKYSNIIRLIILFVEQQTRIYQSVTFCLTILISNVENVLKQAVPRRCNEKFGSLILQLLSIITLSGHKTGVFILDICLSKNKVFFKVWSEQSKVLHKVACAKECVNFFKSREMFIMF